MNSRQVSDNINLFIGSSILISVWTEVKRGLFLLVTDLDRTVSIDS